MTADPQCPICAAVAVLYATKNGCEVYRCKSCRTQFVHQPPADTSNLYDEGYFFGGNAHGGYQNYDADKAAMRDTFVRALERIEEQHTKGKLLDVGAATGYFLAIARDRGWRVEGIDIAPAARAAAAEKGIEVKTGVLDAGMYAPGTFDAVTLFDVVEHVADPVALLTHAHDILAPGGVLFGVTPDNGSVYARLMGSSWNALCPPEHLVLMNDASVRLALAQAGFEVLWTGRMAKRFTPPYIFQTAARWLGWSVLSRLAAFLSTTPIAHLSVPLDLRDNIFFLARRP